LTVPQNPEIIRPQLHVRKKADAMADEANPAPVAEKTTTVILTNGKIFVVNGSRFIEKNGQVQFFNTKEELVGTITASHILAIFAQGAFRESVDSKR
jgi:hypothetical protein